MGTRRLPSIDDSNNVFSGTPLGQNTILIEIMVNQNMFVTQPFHYAYLCPLPPVLLST
jgi:hypothetical protein